MLVTFEPNVAQRSVASQNDHKSKACLPEASNTASTMYRCLKRRLRRLYEAPFLATFFLAPHSSSPPGVEENDGKKRNKEVEEGGGQHHVQGVACELLLLINVNLKEKRSRKEKVIFDI